MTESAKSAWFTAPGTGFTTPKPTSTQVPEFAFDGESSIGGGQTAMASSIAEEQTAKATKTVAPRVDEPMVSAPMIAIPLSASRGQFAFNGHSSIGGGQTATGARTGKPPTLRSRRERGFAFNGHSSIGGGQTAVAAKSVAPPTLRTRRAQEQFKFDGHSSVGHRLQGQAAVATKPVMMTATAAGESSPDEPPSAMRPFNRRDLADDFTFDGKSNVGNDETKPPRQQAGTPAKRTAPRKTPTERIAARKTPAERITARKLPREGTQDYRVKHGRALLQGFTFDGKSGIGSEETKSPEQAGPRTSPRKTASAVTPEERIARGRALLQCLGDERFRGLLAPHLAAFTQDKIDEAELAQRKAEARAEANEVESELAGRKAELDECEALLGLMGEVQASELELSQQLEEAWTARGEAMGELEAALNEAGL